MTPLTKRWFEDKLLWGILILAAIILLPVLIEPLGFDDAIPQLAALDFIRLGRIPYIGFFDQNFPGFFYLHIIEVLLLGPSDIGVRIFDIIIQLFFVAFLYRFASRWTNRSTAALTAILYILYYVSAGSEVYGQRDVYIAMLLFIGSSFLIPSDRPLDWKSIIASGFVLGMTILIRPTSLLFTSLIALFLLLDESFRMVRRRFTAAVVFFLCSLVPISAVIAYYAQISGGLGAFYLATIRFNLDTYTKLPTNHSFWWEMARMSFLIIFAIVGALAKNKKLVSRNLTPRERALYLSFIISALFIVLLQAKYFRYHFAPFFMLILPLAAIGIEDALSRIRGLRKVPRFYLMAVFCFLCTFIRFKPVSSLAFGLGFLEHKDPFETTYRIDHSDSLYGAIPEQRLLRYMRLASNSKGVIEICSLDPVLRLHLRRTCASRYPTLQHLAMTASAKFERGSNYTNYQLRWQRDYIDTLQVVRPRFIIVARKMKFWAVDDFNAFLNSLPGFDSLLDNEYREDTIFGGYEIYRLNSTRG
ncbi:MAG: glycosyltransferase family 39 protein [Candidatus Kapaibacterium sp.]